MDWRIQRQIIIFSTYALIVLFISGSFIWYINYSPNNEERQKMQCFNRKQDNKETGTDCGGPTCELRCDGTYRNVKILFVKALKSTEGRYDILAVLQNDNTEVYFPRIPYNIELFSAEGKSLGTSTPNAATSILPQSKAVVLITSVPSNQEPKTIDFTIDTQNMKALAYPNPDGIPRNISVENWQAQRGANNSLQVVGEIKNPNNQEVRNIDVYALLYDDTKTVYAVSKTKVFSLKGREKTAVAFTWGDVLSPTNVDFVVVLEQ